MRSPRPLPPSHSGRPFSVADALSAGIPSSRLRRSDLRSPFHGVRVPVGAAGLRAECESYATRMPETWVFSHTTAARLLGLPLPRRLEREPGVHVTAVGGRAPRGKGVIGHTTVRDPRVWQTRGLRITAPERTWADLAPLLTLDELIVVGDRIVGLPRPPGTPIAMHGAVQESAGMRGSLALADALELVREGSRSPRETRARVALIRAGMPEPALNAEIVLPRRIVHGDLVFREWRTLVEYEGDQHRTDAVQWSRDLERYNDLVEAGWLVIRVSKSMPSGEVVARVARALHSRGCRAG
ncbi:hypothetical protein ASD56_10970 [Microbacterium sp. Root166]|nr:hypothetical protein ASD56_10970 [Microbacterium sp. Root166]